MREKSTPGSEQGVFHPASPKGYESARIRERRAQLEKIEQSIHEIGRFFLSGRSRQSFIFENATQERDLLLREIAALERWEWQGNIRVRMSQHTEDPGSLYRVGEALYPGLIDARRQHRSRLVVAHTDTFSREAPQQAYSLQQTLLRSVLNHIYTHVPESSKADFIQLLQRHSLAVLLTDRTLMPAVHHDRLHEFEEKVRRILGHQGVKIRKYSALEYIHHIVEQLSSLEGGTGEFE